jgi:CRP-like cAMP-binding protein
VVKNGSASVVENGNLRGHRLEPKDCFGQLSLLGSNDGKDVRVSADIKAVQPTACLQCTRDVFLRYSEIAK